MAHEPKPDNPAPEEFIVSPALENLAVAHCYQVWQTVYRRVMKTKRSPALSSSEAAGAFRLAMPPLAGSQNIRDFITCVGFAMTADIFLEGTGSKLLYAAQIALNAAEPPHRTPKT
jgi:hypothetical protein